MNPVVAQVLRMIAAQLERWAAESVAGGWSTHQVEAQRALAQRIYAAIGKDNLHDLL